MLDLRLSPEQFDAAGALRKSGANQFRSIGYSKAESLSPMVRVRGSLRIPPCIDFDCSALAIPTVHVLDGIVLARLAMLIKHRILWQFIL